MDGEERCYPRPVTAPGGATRWQAADGRTYDTMDEAEAVLPSELQLKPSQPTGVGMSILGAFIAIGLASLVMHLPFTDWEGFDLKWWHWLAFPLGGFMVLGLGVQGAASLYARVKRLPAPSWRNGFGNGGLSRSALAS